MGKKNFFSSFHPVENKISCTEHLLQNKHYIFPGLNVCSKKICDTNFIKCITKSYSIPLLNIHRPLPCLSSKFNKLTSKVKYLYIYFSLLNILINYLYNENFKLNIYLLKEIVMKIVF